MHGPKLAVLLVILIGVVSSCATMVHGSTQAVRVTAGETDANIKLLRSDGSIADVGPNTTISLPRGNGYFQGANYHFLATKEGFTQERVSLVAELDPGWYLVGNVPSGFLGWIAVDPATGAMWKLSTVEQTAQVPTTTGPAINLKVSPVESRIYDPVVAGLLSVAPGGGYFYLGEWGRGFLAAGASYIALGTMYGLAYTKGSESTEFKATYGAAVGLIVLTIVDSVHLAIDAREKQRIGLLE